MKCVWEEERRKDKASISGVTPTAKAPEAQERLEMPRVQGFIWRPSCTRSRPHTQTSCGLHHGERAESLSPEAEEDAKACGMTQTSHTGGSSSTQATKG